MDLILEEDFIKPKIYNNAPKITEGLILKYISTLTKQGANIPCLPVGAIHVDCVHFTRLENCLLEGTVVTASKDSGERSKYKVSMVLDEEDEISSIKCESCEGREPCEHAIKFLFWTHRKTVESEESFSAQKKDASSTESKEKLEDVPVTMKLKDLFHVDTEKSIDVDSMLNEDEGNEFLNSFLNELEKNGLTELPIYRHCRPAVDALEPLYIHHTLLDGANNDVRDYKTFILYMEDVANRGLFERLQEESVYNYKSRMWLETQYGRIRCSQMNQVALRTDPKQDEDIFNSIVCAERAWSVEERQQLKEHKRFILKQTEKLVSKEYKQCGILLNKSYPYICASPDGLADDHIVEIKAPKTNAEFEKFLQGKETISDKYNAQLQIQMFFANVTKALYCVLSPSFETNGALHYVWVRADQEQLASLINAAEDYWQREVFSRLHKIYLTK